MADILAIPRLFDAVVARFLVDGTNTPNVFGWREPAQQMRATSRIAWVPGDEAGGMGDVGPAKYPGESAAGPRSLATLNERVTVIINGYDSTNPEDERAQYIATRLLYDAWFRAVYLSGFGTFSVVSNEWLTKTKERRHGAAIRVVLAVQAKIPDEAHPAVLADTSVVASVTHVEDRTETIDVTKTDPEE
jgi:hypothetical protein